MEIINLEKLNEKKKKFLAKVIDANIKKKIKKVSPEEADSLGKKLYDLISSRGYNDNVEKAIDLVIRGANVNWKNEKEDTALLRCCRTGYPNTVALLIAAGVDVNLANNYQTTPVMSAARHNLIDILKMLVYSGADINRSCQDGDTALISAYRHNAKECINFLISNQANLTAENVNSETIYTYTDDIRAVENLEENKEKDYTHEDAMNIIDEAQKKLKKIKGND